MQLVCNLYSLQGRVVLIYDCAFYRYFDFNLGDNSKKFYWKIYLFTQICITLGVYVVFEIGGFSDGCIFLGATEFIDYHDNRVATFFF